MLRINQEVRIIGRPANNRDWDIPTRLVGQLAIVIDIRMDERIRVALNESGDTWNFPYDYEGVLEPVYKNKWNKLNYISPFKPLNLP